MFSRSAARRQTLLLGGQKQFVYTQAARDTNRQPHTGMLETGQAPQCRLPPQGCTKASGQGPICRGGPTQDQDTCWDLIAKKALKISDTSLQVPSCPGSQRQDTFSRTPVEALNPLSVSSSVDGLRWIDGVPGWEARNRGHPNSVTT